MKKAEVKKMATRYDYKKYRKKFISKHKSFTVNLEYDRDADVIKWLSSQDNKSNAIRKALRKAAENDKRRGIY